MSSRGKFRHRPPLAVGDRVAAPGVIDGVDPFTMLLVVGVHGKHSDPVDLEEVDSGTRHNRVPAPDLIRMSPAPTP